MFWSRGVLSSKVKKHIKNIVQGGISDKITFFFFLFFPMLVAQYFVSCKQCHLRHVSPQFPSTSVSPSSANPLTD